MTEKDSRLLLSKELEGQVPDLENSLNDYLYSNVCIYLKDSHTGLELDGLVLSFSISDEIAVELKLNLDRAFFVVKNKDDVRFETINFILKENLLRLDGDYQIIRAKMAEIDINQQECNLELIIKNCV